MIEPTQQEIMDLFPEDYEGYVSTDKPEVEMDEDLGLEIVQKQSLEAKYNLSPLPDNDFISSLREQFDKKGYLSPKQLACLRR